MMDYYVNEFLDASNDNTVATGVDECATSGGYPARKRNVGARHYEFRNVVYFVEEEDGTYSPQCDRAKVLVDNAGNSTVQRKFFKFVRRLGFTVRIVGAV